MACEKPCQQILIAAETVTECVCPRAGYCERHQCEKTEHFQQLCRRRPDYFRLWEEKRGPCISVSGYSQGKFLPLGTWLARGIKRVTFGKVAPCLGCQSRAAALDRWGAEMWRAPLTTTKTTLRIAIRSLARLVRKDH